jgi:hypothetical protein
MMANLQNKFEAKYLPLNSFNKNWIVWWPAARRQGEERGNIDNGGYTGMAFREEAHFGLTGMEWNRINCFGPDWNGLELIKSVLAWCNGLEWRKSVLARLEWLGIEEVGFGLIVMAWNGGSRFWPIWNGLEWQMLVLALLEWLGMVKDGILPDSW